MSDIRFCLTDIRTGLITAYLPSLQCTTLEYRMEEPSNSQFNLPLDDAPKAWTYLTAPYRAAVVVLDGDTPIWGGVVIKRQRTLGSPDIILQCATPEDYLNRLYMPTVTYTQVLQTELGGEILSTALAGHDFAMTVDSDDSIHPRDRTYDGTQTKTVLSALQDLGNVIDGVEWESKWVMDGGMITPHFIFSDHIGVQRPYSFSPHDMASLQMTEDWSNGFAANRVNCVGQAAGADQPQSGWQTVQDLTRPTLDYRFSASGTDISTQTLIDHARQELASISNGTTTWQMSLEYEKAPTMWKAWQPGDVISLDLSDARAFPDTQTVSLRMVGYKIDFSGGWTLTPVVQGA